LNNNEVSSSARKKRERTFTRSANLQLRSNFESNSSDEDELEKMPKPTIYNVTIFPKPLEKTMSRPLILIRNLTKTESNSNKKKFGGTIERTSNKNSNKVYLNSNNTRTAIIPSKSDSNSSSSSGTVDELSGNNNAQDGWS